MENKQTEGKSSIVAPKDWPGAFGLYKLSKEAILVNWQSYVALILLAAAFSLVTSLVFGSNKETLHYDIGQLISVLLSVFISTATTLLFLRSVERKTMSFSLSLSEALNFFVAFIAMSFLVYIALFVSFLLLVVPFFFVMPRLSLAPYALIDKNLGPIEAIQASWDMTKEHVGKVYGIIGVNLLFVLLVFTIIGIPFAMYFVFMYSAASALLYRWITANSQQTLPQK